MDFSGFDVSAGGNYLAYVARKEPADRSAVIERMDLKTEKVEQFPVVFSVGGK